MTQVSMKLDYMTSLLMSHHVVCAPTVDTAYHNPELIRRLGATAENRCSYLTHWLSLGYVKSNMDWVRPTLFMPGSFSIEEYCLRKGWPEAMRTGLREFDCQFRPYFSDVEKLISPEILSLAQLTQDVTDRACAAAARLTGVELHAPDTLDIRIVEGYAPSGQCINKDDRMYLLVSTYDLREPSNYYNSLIHELVGHKPCAGTEPLNEAIFGRYQYSVEEAFAKALTHKVAGDILDLSMAGIGGGDESFAYDLFNSRWGELKGLGFAKWYDSCMRDIRDAYASMRRPAAVKDSGTITTPQYG